MMRTFFLGSFLLITLFARSQAVGGYKSLDPKQPIVFGGDHIVFNGQTIRLGPKAFFIDGQLSEKEVSGRPFVFNSVNEAAKQLSHGTEASPMVLYLAPYVYWIDDPDDPAIRVPKEGATPYGLVINCEWLTFQGLTSDAQNVVLASNRGQTIGARGNFTMFKFNGQGTRSENITFGNYCNVDLVYPLKPQLGRPKRASAIVQAQLIHCNGDKVIARNTRFISRLNLCPFTGAKRVLFDRCHFESTDDALCGTGVYLNSTLDFYSSKPFYHTTGTGAVFLNCDIRSFAGDKQFFTKAGGQVAVVDCRFTGDGNGYWGWQDVVPAAARNYQANVRLNRKPYLVGKADPAATVEMSRKPLLHAYRFIHNGKLVYNTYNLLQGHDDWDPMGIKPIVAAAEKKAKTAYTQLPVQLLLSPSGHAIETKKNDVLIKAKLVRFGNYVHGGEKLQWTVDAKDRPFVRLNVSEDGAECRVVPTNTTGETKHVVVRAFTAAGLEGASVLAVAPPMLAAPLFSTKPAISLTTDGDLIANYKLVSAYADQSDIRWYRCTDAQGSHAIEVAVSRFNKPARTYVLSAGDVGYYLMVAVAPKHNRSVGGDAVHAVMQRPITAGDVKAPANRLVTDFTTVSLRNQPKVLPGFWTLDYLRENNVDQRASIDTTRDAWYYGEGSDGAAGMQGLLQGRNGVAVYTPVGKTFGNMKLSLKLAPFKTAGQGFSVAPLYMDVVIRFDAATRSGYALRFIRTTKYHNAVDCMLVRYKNGEVVPVGQPVSTSAFRTLCTITLEIKGSVLTARVKTTAPDAEPRSEGVQKEVYLEGTIEPSPFGGFGMVYNGGSPTLVQELKAEWE